MDPHSGPESPALPVEKPSPLPSVVALVLVSVATLAGLYLYGNRRGHPRRDTGKSQLKQIGVYVALYESTYKAYPPDAGSFDRMLRGQGTDARALLECPACRGRIEVLWQAAPSGTWSPPGGTPYSWTASGITHGAPPDLPIAWHRCSHPGEADDGSVLFFQGRVDVFAPGGPLERAIVELAGPRSK